jgi:hypothetical protein
MASRSNSNRFEAVIGGNVKHMSKKMLFGAMALVAASLVGSLSGCKSAPELAQADAQKMIQAKLDAQPAAGVNITVDDQGMQIGANAKLWDRTKVYPNKFWADFTLTAEGKKAIKLANGGDTIQWRPESLTDKSFSVVISSIVATHPKAKDVQAAQDETLAGASAAKAVAYTEAVSLDGVPDALQQIAHTPGNKLSTKKQADFVLDGGAWKLQGIQ